MMPLPFYEIYDHVIVDSFILFFSFALNVLVVSVMDHIKSIHDKEDLLVQLKYFYEESMCSVGGGSERRQRDRHGALTASSREQQGPVPPYK